MGFWPEHKPFRSVEEWKSALMTLPENSFFELLRSVLGNIKTPFRKQVLLDDLVNLLSREEIRKTISVYLNEQDRKVIVAVALLHEPTSGDLGAFFTGEFSPAELHANIINLEERLIIYRIKGKENLHLALNPVLEEVLAPLVSDIHVLFPYHSDETDSDVAEAHTKGTFVLEDRIIAALFAFMQSEEEVFRPEGGIRKKVLDGKKNLSCPGF